MPSAALVQAAALKHRNMLMSAYGQSIFLDNVSGSGRYEAPRWEQKLADGGFKDVYLTTLVIRKADWPAFAKPADFLQKVVRIKVGNVWQNFGIIDQGVVDSFQSGEWKIQLEGLT